MKCRQKAWLTAVVFSLASPIAPGCSPQVTTLESVLTPLEGDWIRRETLETLARTRSPLAAASGDVVAFTLERTPSGFDWTLHPGFHESIVREISDATRADGQIRLQHDDETATDSFVLAGDEIEWLHKTQAQSSRTRFAPARPSLAALVNRVVLAGEYRDAEDRAYVFTEQGAAQWPDTSGQYSIALDSESDACDVFVLERGAERTAFAFRFDGTELFLFREQDDSTLRCTGSPTLTLEKR